MKWSFWILYVHAFILGFLGATAIMMYFISYIYAVIVLIMYFIWAILGSMMIDKIANKRKMG